MTEFEIDWTPTVDDDTDTSPCDLCGFATRASEMCPACGGSTAAAETLQELRGGR